MKRSLFLAAILLCPLAAQASTSMEEAFDAYVKVKQIEAKLSLAEQEESRQELAAALTSAKIEFHSIARSDHEELESWEKKALERVTKTKPAPKKVDPEALAFLKKSFGDAKSLSVLEWQVVQEFFGRVTQESFLKESFGAGELAKIAPSEKNIKVILILDPFRRLLGSKDSLEKKDLEELNLSVDAVEISSFASVENQAEELRHYLLKKSNESYVLVSSGEASAVVHKLLDLHPSFRTREELVGWVNADGRLFGRAPEPKENKGRKIASIEHSRADRFESDALSGLRQLRLESLERQAPLGLGFPILNLISTDESFRATKNLRESIVADGSNIFIGKGPAWKRIREAITQLKSQ